MIDKPRERTTYAKRFLAFITAMALVFGITLSGCGPREQDIPQDPAAPADPATPTEPATPPEPAPVPAPEDQVDDPDDDTDDGGTPSN